MSRENERWKWRNPGEETGRTVGTVSLLLGSEGDIEVELESSPEWAVCGSKDEETQPFTHGQTSCTAKFNTDGQGDTKSTCKRGSSGRQGGHNGAEREGGVAVSWFSPEKSLNRAVELLRVVCVSQPQTIYS